MHGVTPDRSPTVRFKFFAATPSRAATAALLLTALLVQSCASWSRKGQGAAIGAAAGAAIGAATTGKTGNTTRNAIIGAAVGGTIGAVIGHQMDQQAKELQQNIPGATVTRVGEGIAISFESGLLYGFDSDAVLATAGENLRNLSASLNKYPNTDLMIVGHTDATGSDSYNQGLSERRARSAAAYLARQGVSASRIRALGRGESEPIESNDSDAGRAANRRIEIAIVANQSARRP
jgi:outer membrane protein OmpA-like peptidoglycan-associated protein